jgi:osmotically-inducible protein OsmY
MSDTKLISDEIRARYDRDPRIPHPGELAVSDREGTVILRGSVGSFSERRAAVDIAKTTPGVRAVEDELAVDIRDRWDDNEVRGAALQALMSRADGLDDMVDVSVHSGWLTLKGQVKHQDESNAAFEAVSGLPGVGGITNEIKVVTAAGH